MKLSEHKELKKEILALPAKEKDKLLLRLIAKDKVLTERLHFELLEDSADLEDRVSHLRDSILSESKRLKLLANVHPKDVILALRKLTREVNHFFKVTKAKTEEVELKLALLAGSIMGFRKSFRTSFKQDERKFQLYFVKSVQSLLKKYRALHEDLQFDLRGDMQALLDKVYEGELASVAKELDVPDQLQ